tara:strand:+ start:308 stop:532 length:225 start_codon:yes stop_codon:yes gene_type:complete
MTAQNVERTNIGFDYRGYVISLSTIAQPPELLAWLAKTDGTIFGPVSPTAEGIRDAMAHIDDLLDGDNPLPKNA